RTRRRALRRPDRDLERRAVPPPARRGPERPRQPVLLGLPARAAPARRRRRAARRRRTRTARQVAAARGASGTCVHALADGSVLAGFAASGRRNGLVAYRQGLDTPPHDRAPPAALDLQVRAIVPLDDGPLLALLGMDENLPHLRALRRPALLASRDDGRTWTVVHSFAADWSDEPDDLVPLRGRRVWAIGGTTNHV